MVPVYSAMSMFPQAVAAILQAIERLARHTIVTCRQALQQIHFTSLTVLDILSYHLQTGIEAVRGFWPVLLTFHFCQPQPQPHMS